MEEPSTPLRAARRRELDGLRGIAVLLVMFAHVRLPHTDGAGTIGVTIFFVLSGFLITGLMLEESGPTGRIDLVAFWQRRAQRLLPALLVFLGVMVLAGALLGVGPVLAPWQQVVSALMFVSNWLWASGFPDNGIAHTWSLAVEEQFYLVWPVVVWVVLRLSRAPRRTLAVLAGVGILLSWAAKVLLAVTNALPERQYAGTDVRAFELLLGCLLACVASQAPRWVRPATAAAAVLCVPLIAGMSSSIGGLFITQPVAALAAAGVIWIRSGSPLLSWGPIRYVGRRSYALYLWHHPLFVLGLGAFDGWAWVARAAVLIPAAFGLAELSWRYVERPVLSGRRLQAQPAL